MISDDKKEEVRAAADIVEVVSDHVKLKKSGSGFVGLCPYHNEKTPSFNVTPRLGIFKCFGCGESGDVFKFVMDQEGIGFTDAIRQLADRYGVFIPEEEEGEPDERSQHREGIYHALKFAGVFFYRNLIENPEAEKARTYLEDRGYSNKVIKKFGLGYAPGGGEELIKAAANVGIDEKYLLDGDLIKPSQRGEGYYDTFRDRLMFPIFSPSGKVIAFAGRVLGNKKTAKYINSAQTQVYNKSDVVYGVNFARNEIRKNKEVILVEGYTDVITLNINGIENVVASSGTSLTSGQMRILHRYGEKIIMIYDSDDAGQNAMKRGIDIALGEGMEVQLLELPEDQDPDSFVKQFGKDSFTDLKREEAKDFVDFLMMKAGEEGRLDQPVELKKVISEILRSIAHIPDSIQRQVYVQHLHNRTQKYRRGSDRDLYEELDRIRAEVLEQEKKAQQRMEKQQERERRTQSEGPPPGFSEVPMPGERRQVIQRPAKKPHYEKELIRLMISYGRKMVEYVCSFTNDKLLEDDELRDFYKDIVKRYTEESEISVNAYSSADDPFPRLVGDVMMERYTASDRHHEKVGLKYEKDKDPFRSAKSVMRTLELQFYRRKRAELADRLKSSSDDEERRKIIRKQSDIQAKITYREKADAEDLYPDPDSDGETTQRSSRFEYKMKHERED